MIIHDRRLQAPMTRTSVPMLQGRQDAGIEEDSCCISMLCYSIVCRAKLH